MQTCGDEPSPPLWSLFLNRPWDVGEKKRNGAALIILVPPVLGAFASLRLCDNSETSARELFFQIADDLADIGIDFHAVLDQTTGVEDGAVVASAKGLADGGQ